MPQVVPPRQRGYRTRDEIASAIADLPSVDVVQLRIDVTDYLDDEVVTDE